MLVICLLLSLELTINFISNITLLLYFKRGLYTILFNESTIPYVLQEMCSPVCVMIFVDDLFDDLWFSSYYV